MRFGIGRIVTRSGLLTLLGAITAAFVLSALWVVGLTMLGFVLLIAGVAMPGRGSRRPAILGASGRAAADDDSGVEHSGTHPLAVLFSDVGPPGPGAEGSSASEAGVGDSSASSSSSDGGSSASSGD